MEEQKSNTKKVSIFICSACFFLFVAILILVTVSGAIKDLMFYEKANFVEVEATIVEYKEQKDYSSSYYVTFYEYKSPNGRIYSGFWQTKIKTEEEAKAQIGKKVPLYVDDELKLQTKSLNVDKTGVIVGVVFGSVCLLVSIGFFTHLAIYFVHWRKGGVSGNSGEPVKKL